MTMAEVASKINATDLNAFLIDIILSTTNFFHVFRTFDFVLECIPKG